MSRRSSEAQARAAADRAYLEQVRGDAAADSGSAVGQPSAAGTALPSPPTPAPLEQTEVMPHVPTAAPSPVLGVSPILGEQAAPSAPPVGSFPIPPVGPPGPAFPSQTAVAAASAAGGPSSARPSTEASDAAGSGQPLGQPEPSHGMGPGPLRKAGARREPSFVEQNPVGAGTIATATLAPPQQYSAPQYSAPQYPAAQSAAVQYAASPSPSSEQRAPLLSAGADLPLLLGPDGIAPKGDLVTCPECGEMATVDAAKRNSQDFCRNCDFPLFWARSTVILPSDQETGASLRRLPGTVGRAATAALVCPHCGEPNSPTAQNCVRCLLSLHPVEPPPPAPVYVAPPPPPPMPVPIGREYPLWWILLVSGCAMAIILIVVWIAAN